MALRNAQALTLKPTGVTDAVDGTNTFPGSMQALANLIPATDTDKQWVPRPASVNIGPFPIGVPILDDDGNPILDDYGFLIWDDNYQGNVWYQPGFISCLCVVGDIAYGMVADFPGYDFPFAFNILRREFLPIDGAFPTNLPLSPSPTGDWTPPIATQVGNRIVVTHPGFPGGPLKFGWFDISGFVGRGIKGNLKAGSNIITSILDLGGNSAPIIDGVQPGQVIAGAGLGTGAIVNSAANGTVDIETTGNTTVGNKTITNIGHMAGILVGMSVAGESVTAGSYVKTVNVAGRTVTLSQAATATTTAAILTFSGGGSITMNFPALATADLVELTVRGGTPTRPLWGGGDTNVNNLPSVPVGVAQMSGRAYFALLKDGVAFSDPLNACNITNANQFLTFGNGLAITGVWALPLYTAVTGGIVQSIIAFQGVSAMQQITGDALLLNLSVNALNVATGTFSPLSVCPTNIGLAFVSPEGLRFIDFGGRVSDPIGDHGSGITVPLIYTTTPTRVAAASGSDVLRISVQNGYTTALPNQEYWYDLTRKTWSGPHSFPASLIQPWQNSFVMTPVGIDASIWQSDPIPNIDSTYNENSIEPLTWTYTTTLLPDNTTMSMNAMVETNIGLAMVAASSVTVTFTDENDTVVDTVTITQGGVQPLWNAVTWNEFLWGPVGTAYRQRQCAWHIPLVFKQAEFTVTGVSAYGVRIGDLFMRYQQLGYDLEMP